MGARRILSVRVVASYVHVVRGIIRSPYMGNVLSVKARASVIAKPTRACLIFFARAEAERPSDAINAAAQIAAQGAEKLRNGFPQIASIVVSQYKIAEKDRRAHLKAPDT